MRAGCWYMEELCDTHRVLLRAGQILFHQPAELFAMRAVGEVPPEVFRMEFTADGSAMDSFRSCHMRLGNAEKSCLRQLAETVREVFQPVQDACQMPQAAHPQTKPPCSRRAGAGSPCGKRAPVLCAEH